MLSILRKNKVNNIRLISKRAASINISVLEPEVDQDSNMIHLRYKKRRQSSAFEDITLHVEPKIDEELEEEISVKDEDIAIADV